MEKEKEKDHYLFWGRLGGVLGRFLVVLGRLGGSSGGLGGSWAALGVLLGGLGPSWAVRAVLCSTGPTGGVHLGQFSRPKRGPR